jgi:quinol monooxygenase YgiN
MAEVYSHGTWQVKAGQEEAFIAAWKEMWDVFLALPSPAVRGTLVQSLRKPTLFYSFGPWRSAEDIEAMLQDARAQEALQKVRSLCTEVTTGTFQEVADVG